MLLREVGSVGTDWINLAQETEQWWALVSTVMNLGVPSKAGSAKVAKELLASQGLCSCS